MSARPEHAVQFVHIRQANWTELMSAPPSARTARPTLCFDWTRDA